jgi:hypothetical protein
MMNRPKVYIIKEQMVRDATGSNSMDYSPAMMYGDIEFITRSDMPTYPNSTIRMKWNEDVARFVEAYDPGKDFIITTGQPTAIFAVGHALGVSGKVPRYLIWRREENRYRALDTPSPEFNQ